MKEEASKQHDDTKGTAQGSGETDLRAFLSNLSNELSRAPNAALLVTCMELMTQLNLELGKLLSAFPAKQASRRFLKLHGADHDDQLELAMRILACRPDSPVSDICKEVLRKPYWADGFKNSRSLARGCANRPCGISSKGR